MAMRSLNNKIVRYSCDLTDNSPTSSMARGTLAVSKNPKLLSSLRMIDQVRYNGCDSISQSSLIHSQDSSSKYTTKNYPSLEKDITIPRSSSAIGPRPVLSKPNIDHNSAEPSLVKFVTNEASWSSPINKVFEEENGNGDRSLTDEELSNQSPEINKASPSSETLEAIKSLKNVLQEKLSSPVSYTLEAYRKIETENTGAVRRNYKPCSILTKRRGGSKTESTSSDTRKKVTFSQNVVCFIYETDRAQPKAQ